MVIGWVPFYNSRKVGDWFKGDITDLSKIFFFTRLVKCIYGVLKKKKRKEGKRKRKRRELCNLPTSGATFPAGLRRGLRLRLTALGLVRERLPHSSAPVHKKRAVRTQTSYNLPQTRQL